MRTAIRAWIYPPSTQRPARSRSLRAIISLVEAVDVSVAQEDRYQPLTLTEARCCNATVRQLAVQCQALNPAERPTFAEVNAVLQQIADTSISQLMHGLQSKRRILDDILPPKARRRRRLTHAITVSCCVCSINPDRMSMGKPSHTIAKYRVTAFAFQVAVPCTKRLLGLGVGVANEKRTPGSL